MSEKIIEIVAGPNGSGKSTFAETLFSKRKNADGDYFINPDTIARGFSLTNSEVAAFHAGRLMIQSVTDLIKRGESFAFESTLSGKTWLNALNLAIGQGYMIRIYFIFLERVSENIRRVKSRVLQGGHSIPTEVIRRRYPKSIYNFWNLYRPVVQDWLIFDNSDSKPKLVQSRSSFELLNPSERQQFSNRFLKGKRNGAN